MLNKELIGVANVQNKLMATPFNHVNVFRFIPATTVWKFENCSASQILRENGFDGLGSADTVKVGNLQITVWKNHDFVEKSQFCPSNQRFCERSC